MLLPLAIGSLFLAAASEGQDDALKRAWFLNDYGIFAELVFRKSPEEIAKIEAWLTRGRSEAIDNQEKRTMDRLHRFLEAMKIQRVFVELVHSNTLTTGQSMDGRYFSADLVKRDAVSVYYLREALWKIVMLFGAAAQEDLREQTGSPFEINAALISGDYDNDGAVSVVIDMDTWPSRVAFGPPVEDFFVAYNITVHD
jgi:hypothetical protein